ncbi:MAG: ATP-binding cassette domain-containing protein, partial [Planctomycetota bacterium]
MLRADELSVVYPNGVRALDSVCLQVDDGMFGMLGPNGAGKSTLMRVLATLQSPTAGRASFGETDLLGNPREARRLIGYLPQDVGAYPRVSAWEMLEYLAGLRGIGPARERGRIVRRALERVNLGAVADQRLDTYSGGMLRRFGIATVFLADPKLVIVDEPTAGLDPTERRRFQCMLAEAAEGRVLLISSHIVEDIAGLCGELVVLDHGRIVRQGTPGGLAGELDARVWKRRVSAAELSVMQQDYRVLSWRPESGGVLVRVLGDDLGLRGFTPASPDLEDVFGVCTT